MKFLKKLFFGLIFLFFIGVSFVSADQNSYWYLDGASPNVLHPLDGTWDVNIGGDLLVSGSITSAGVTLSGDLSLDDNIAINFGDDQDASIVYDNSDSDSHNLIIGVPADGADNNPCVVIAPKSKIGTPLNFFHPYTQPCLAITNATGTSYTNIYHDGSYGRIRSSAGGFAFGTQSTNHGVTGDGDLIVARFEANSSVYFDGDVFLKNSKSTTGDPTGGEGMIYYNTFDNALKIYADGAWRTITTW